MVTTNDYLARRDAAWVGRVLRFLGLTVGVIQAEMNARQKRDAYRPIEEVSRHFFDESL